MDDIDVAILSSRVLDTKATLTDVKKMMTFQKSIMDEIVGGLGDMVERMQASARAAMEAESKIYASKMTVNSNLGASASQMS